MTGFGRAAGRVGGRRLSIEIQSVNHRSLSVKMRLPETLAPLERAMREAVEAAAGRGSVTVSVEWGESDAPEALEISQPVLASYARQIRTAAAKAKIPLDIRAGDLLNLPGVLRAPRGRSLAAVAPKVTALLRKALAQFDGARQAEGRALARVLGGHLSRLASHVERVEKRQPEEAARAVERLKKRLADLMAGHAIAEGDLLREAAIQAGRADTSEEIARIRSHCARLRENLAQGGAVGRSLDFLCQELVRETNTLASKLQSADLVADAIAAKAEVDRLREQAANVA